MARAANISESFGAEAAAPDYMESGRSLIERFLEGDREAFAALYRQHHPAVLRSALYMTGDPAAAAEVTQDVFVWLIHHPAAFDPARGEFPAFLNGVARKVLHRRERTLRRWLPFSEAAPRKVDSAAALDRALDSASVRKAIALLPVRYREAVVLCDLEGKSYEEAAGLLSCAVGTIRSRLHRGRELLARKFQPKKEARS